jgi:Fur family transcriptional regulator, zinc uptake regulator
MIERKAAPFPSHDHDHETCVVDALTRAQLRCEAMGIKWTSLREQVFRRVATSHKPVSAYDLIEALAEEGRRLAPVSVYRILDVLQSAGLVHRLESRNAFFACMTEHPALPQSITFLCEICEWVSEVDASDALRAIDRASEASGFHSRGAVIEVSGICADCYGTADDKRPC